MMVHTILVGDAREQLATLPDNSVQTCVTSPPYYGLRDYNVDGQIGLEASVEDYIEAMVSVFREVRRVLKDDGTCWVNLGDSYASSGTAGHQRLDELGERLGTGGGKKHSASLSGRAPTPIGLKPKDLIGIPWRVALALQADGWWLRQDIVWAKSNPMPESVQDRCTSSHEYIFLLSKSARYYFDAAAIREPMKDVSLKRLSQPNVLIQEGGPKDPKDGNRSHRKAIRNQAEKLIKHEKWKDRFEGWDEYDKSLGRNKRSVWNISTKPYPEAHFATFPPEIPETCIKAGSREGDTVLDPFAGSGTTGEVAEFLGRRVVLIELNPAYVPLIEKRLAQRTIWDALSIAD